MREREREREREGKRRKKKICQRTTTVANLSNDTGVAKQSRREDGGRSRIEPAFGNH